MISSQYCDGLEIDMLAIGDADCILVTRWESGLVTRVLIDGGDAGTVDSVCAFLIGLGVSHIDHVICSHPHDDHAAGLVLLLKDQRFTFGRLWMHQPWCHIDLSLVARAWAEGKAQKVTKALAKSLQTQVDLAKTASTRQIPFDVEPFSGQTIGPLFVCGPSPQFYDALVLEFSNLNVLVRYESELEQMEREQLLEDVLEKVGAPQEPSGLLDDPRTEPENDSATVLWAKYADKTFVFTSDAGVAALERAKEDYQIGGCHWMQIPHHGSRRNITKSLIEYFSPKIAYVSAEGNKKHPRRAVINAFKENGCIVYSTHYPTSTNMWLCRGNVPSRQGYNALTPLWEAQS